MKRIIFYYCGIIVLLSFHVNAQQSFPSSDGQALIRNIQTPVDYSTGIANISIPLYNLNYNGIDLPISLSYNTSGIKVSDRASGLGIGWKLNVGGRITRIVKKYPDETGYHNIELKTPDDLFFRIFSNVNSKFVRYNEIDTEFDLYYFEVLNRSGLFVLDDDGIGFTIPYQPDLEIIKLDNDSWRIKTNDGSIFTFGTQETSREITEVEYKNSNLKSGTENFTYTSSWLLDKIENYSGQAILFTYQKAKTQVIKDLNYVFNYLKTEKRYGDPIVEHKSTEENTSIMTIEPYVIKNITGGKTFITFDYNTYSDRFGRISVKRDVDSFNIIFNYSQTYREDGRAFLKEINQDGTPIVKFAYKETIPTNDFNYPAYDYWGYFAENKFKNSYRPTNIWFSLEDDMDRTPSLNETMNGILTEVIYPEGGRILYEYELNTVNDYYGNRPDTVVGGLRIKSITRQDKAGNTNVSSIFYSGLRGKSSGVRTLEPIDYDTYILFFGDIYFFITLFSKPINHTLDLSGRHVVYTDVQVVNDDKSYTEYQYTRAYDSQNNIYVAVNNRDDYTKTWNDGDQPVFNYFPKDTQFWRRGLLKSVSQYDANGRRVKHEEYEYNFRSKKEFKSYIPIVRTLPTVPEQKTYYALCESTLRSELVLLTKKRVFETDYEPASSTTYSYDEWGNVKKINTEIADDRFETKINYLSDFSFPYLPGLSSNLYPYRLMQDQGVNVPLEVIKTKNGLVIEAEVTTYKKNPVFETPFLHYKALPAKIYSLELSQGISDLQEISFKSDLIMDSRYSETTSFDYYNEHNKILTVRQRGDYVNSYVYDEDGEELLAEVRNASITTNVRSDNTPSEVLYTSFEREGQSIPGQHFAKTGRRAHYGEYSLKTSNIKPGVYTLTYWLSEDEGKTWQKYTDQVNLSVSGKIFTLGQPHTWIDEVRMIPVNAHIKTYTHCLYGKTTETDHNGFTTYWEYGPFGRLWRISDNDKNPLQDFYHNVPKN